MSKVAQAWKTHTKKKEPKMQFDDKKPQKKKQSKEARSFKAPTKKKERKRQFDAISSQRKKKR